MVKSWLVGPRLCRVLSSWEVEGNWADGRVGEKVRQSLPGRTERAAWGTLFDFSGLYFSYM